MIRAKCAQEGALGSWRSSVEGGGLAARAPGRSDGRTRQLAAGVGLCLLAALAGCSSSGGGGDVLGTASGTQTGSGPVVARLEMSAPTRNQFVVRGTVPVPKGTFPRADGKTPFSVLDWDGSPVPTQVETVTWYPDRADGADVVEVLARVHNPPSANTGARITYDVVSDPHVPGKMIIDSGVLGLVTDTGSVLMVAHDVFGNKYVADIARDLRLQYGQNQLRMLRDGAVAKTMSTYHVLQPMGAQTGPPTGATQNLFGVHSYFTAWRGEEIMSLDLRVHNGHSGADNSTGLDNPLGLAYFRDLELWVPDGWTVMGSHEDPLFGPMAPHPQHPQYNVVPLVRARPDGKMHVMPSQGQFHRRLVVAPEQAAQKSQFFLNEDGLAFCRRGPSPTGGELWSWWNPATARYFPQSHRLPELDHIGQQAVRNNLNFKYNQVRTLMLNGTAGNFPTDTPALGWAHPWGAKYGGMTGGSEIFIFDGVTAADAASVEGYRLAQLTHRMYTERHPVAAYNLDGRPTQLQDWLHQNANGPYVTFEFFLKPLNADPFGENQSPAFQRNYVAQNNLAPPYETNLLQFDAIDLQHHVRYTRSPKVLIWLGNDPLAKDDMMMTGELVRLTYHPYPNSAAGYLQGSGLASKMQFVSNNPGRGFAWGRGESWGLDAMSVAYAIQEQPWRSAALPWFQAVADTVSSGQASCSGFIQAIVNPKMFMGQFRARQAIEQSITENALRGMVETVLRDVDSARALQTEFTLEQSLYAMIGPMAWVNNWHGPANFLAVAPVPLNQPPYCGAPPQGGTANGPDHWQDWSSFAYAYALTGDAIFLTRALEQTGGNDLLTELENSGYNALENKAALLALAQSF